MADVDRTLWQGIIQRVVSSGGNIIRPWFTQLEPISLEHGLLEIQAPGRSEQEYCQRYAMRLFTESAQMATGRLVSVCFLTPAQRPSKQSMTLPRVSPGSRLGGRMMQISASAPAWPSAARVRARGTVGTGLAVRTADAGAVAKPTGGA